MKKVLLLLLVSISFSCSDSAKEKDDSAKQGTVKQGTVKQEEGEQELKKEILQAAIDYEKLQWFYIDTTKLIVLKNEIVTEPLSLEKFGKNVVFLDSTELENSAKNHYLVVEKLIIEDDSAHVGLRYPSQGAVANLSLLRADDSWKVVWSEIFEN
ncbi:hypothetical protein GCM10023188_00730 [Pontibacter saemangeumensis]|uniref:Lumazine-binding n=1 Tax=Pontibacter saemangeumensis TaxID=1084525 RepID=A0ABP8L4R7_9BACT